jgi:hypothetical protein
MLENGNLLFLDNGDGRPAAEGGLYSRAPVIESPGVKTSLIRSQCESYKFTLAVQGPPVGVCGPVNKH